MNLSSIQSPYKGKKLSKPQLNLLAKLESFGVTLGENPDKRANTFSGVIHELDPLAVALFDFIIKANGSRFGGLSFNGHKVNVNDWDRARYLFLHLWPDQYYDLID